MPEFLRHHLHSNHYREIDEIYASRTLRSFAVSMVGIFVPIYLWNLGFGIATIAFFFMTAILSRVFFNPASGWLVARFGPKHILGLSYLVEIVNIAALFALSFWPGLVFLPAVIWGITASMFWVATHVEFSFIKKPGKTSRQVSTLTILGLVASALGPLVSGILATRFDIAYSFLVASVVLLFALIPLFLTPETFRVQSFSWRRLRKVKVPRELAANLGSNLDSTVALYVWSFFAFLFLGTYERIGVLITLTLALGIVVSYWVGRRGDKGHNPGQIKLGVSLTSGIHLLRSFAESFLHAFGIGALSELAALLFKIPFTATYYQHADRHSRIEYVVKMEMLGNLGMVVPWLGIFVFSFFISLEATLIMAFILAALAVWLVPLISRSRPEAIPSSSV